MDWPAAELGVPMEWVVKRSASRLVLGVGTAPSMISLTWRWRDRWHAPSGVSTLRRHRLRLPLQHRPRLVLRPLQVQAAIVEKEGPPVDATNSVVISTHSAATTTMQKSQPLWRFALVGLGPLTALGVFALLVAFFQRLA